MNKENKREVRNNATIVHLKKKKQIASIIEIILAICFTIVVIQLIALIALGKNDDDMSNLVILFVLTISIMIIDRINSKLKIQIALKQRELKLAEIKKRAEEGSLLKYPVFYKEDTAAKVIEHDIETIVFQNVANGAITFDIHLKTKFQTATVQIPIQEIILNHLDKEMANSILKDTITNITIDTTEEGKTQVTFLGKDFCVEQTDVTDNDLIEMFGKEM